MKLYLKGDYTKRVPYGYLELAGKMWFPEDEQISYSNAGNNDALQEDFFSNLSLRKGTADKRWSSAPLKDNKASWLTIEEFKRKHEAILSLTFEEANELSLTEIQTMDVVDDPLWEEEANRRKEYILAHGGDISDL